MAGGRLPLAGRNLDHALHRLCVHVPLPELVLEDRDHRLARSVGQADHHHRYPLGRGGGRLLHRLRARVPRAADPEQKKADKAKIKGIQQEAIADQCDLFREMTETIQEYLINAGLNEEAVFGSLLEMAQATQTRLATFEGEFTDSREVPDNSVRLAARQALAKLLGMEPGKLIQVEQLAERISQGETALIIDMSGLSDDKLNELMFLLAQAKTPEGTPIAAEPTRDTLH